MGKVKATLDIERDKEFSLTQIAMIKAWNYGMEYDPVSGREVEKAGFHYLRDGYIDGFLAGFAHKFEHNDKGVE
jgi:hypothetical protein